MGGTYLVIFSLGWAIYGWEHLFWTPVHLKGSYVISPVGLLVSQSVRLWSIFRYVSDRPLVSF